MMRIWKIDSHAALSLAVFSLAVFSRAVFSLAVFSLAGCAEPLPHWASIPGPGAAAGDCVPPEEPHDPQPSFCEWVAAADAVAVLEIKQRRAVFAPTHALGGGTITAVEPADCRAGFAALELDVAVVSRGLGELPEGTFPVRVGGYNLVHGEPAMHVQYPDDVVAFDDGKDYFDRGGRFLAAIYSELGYRSVSAFVLPRVSVDGVVDFPESGCFPDEHQGGDGAHVDDLIAEARTCEATEASAAYRARALFKCEQALGCSVRSYAAWCDFDGVP